MAAVLLPIVVSTPSRQITYATILAFGICAVSVAIITGWAGQLSLGQMAFAGIGAVAAASFQRGIQMDIGWGNSRLIDFEASGIPFAAAVVLGSVIAAGFAGLVGVGALRVRGLLLAVATFVLALATEEYLFRRPIFSDGNTTSVSFRRGQVFGLDLDRQRTYYWLLLGVLVVVLVAVARIHRSRFGRAIRALRDNADAAAAYGVRPARTKLGAFMLAGAVAGLVAFLLTRNLGGGLAVALLAVAVVVGLWAGARHAKDLHQPDPRSVVVDEFCGMWLALVGTNPSVLVIVAAFIAFRFLDIVKPPPVRQVERLPGGIGIMADDLVAGGIVRVVLLLALGM